MFYIPPILRLTPSRILEHVFCLAGSRASFFGTGKKFFLLATVTRSRSLPNWHKTPVLVYPIAPLTGCGFQVDFTPQNTTENNSNGFAACFYPLKPIEPVQPMENPPCRWRGLRPPRGFSHRQAAGGFGGAP